LCRSGVQHRLQARHIQIKSSHFAAVIWNARQRLDRFHAGSRRFYCIICVTNLRIMAFVFGLCRWSANYGRLLSFTTAFPQISV
jgi:hypothetical protein